MAQTTPRPTGPGWRGVMDWLNAHVLHESGMWQAIYCALALACGLLLARTACRWLAEQAPQRAQAWPWRREWLDKRLPGFLRPLFLLLILHAGLAVARDNDWPVMVLEVAARAGEAWLVIQFFAALLLPHGWTGVVTLLVGGFYALEALGALDPLLVYLDGLALNFDNERLSMLEVVKALVLLAVMLPLINRFCGLLEAALEKLAEVKPRVRVLVSKLTKIALYTMALVTALDLVGINVHMLTVFSGAAGLGIGFGLQKVVSNLVSGVILLLDNSIKPGDVIEVGGAYGWVDTMNARYATMVTRDGKAYLIPNDELISDKVVNWSHTGPSVRVRIPVGVAYSTDLDQAKALMLQACEGQARVLDNPKPMVLLREFGENGVVLELRIWVERPERGLARVTSAVQFALWDLFKANGVEFPFPQRDMHLSEPLRVQVERVPPGRDGED